jgi:hypothetical protein
MLIVVVSGEKPNVEKMPIGEPTDFRLVFHVEHDKSRIPREASVPTIWISILHLLT